MGYDMFRGAGNGQLAAGTAERGLTALLEAAERAVEKIGSSVPPAQLRAKGPHTLRIVALDPYGRKSALVLKLS